MQMPEIRNSSDTLLSLMAMHIAKLNAHPQTQHLLVASQKTYDALESAEQIYQKAARDTNIKFAVREYADDVADDAVGMFHTHAFMLANRDKNQAPYAALFPKGLQAVTRLPLREQVSSMQTLLDLAVQQNDSHKTQLAPQIEQTLSAKNTLSQAVDAYEEALRQEGLAKVNVTLAKENVLRQYQTNYGHLIATFGSKKAADRFYSTSYDRTRKADGQAGGQTDGQTDGQTVTENGHVTPAT